MKAGVTTTILAAGPNSFVGKFDNFGTVNWVGSDLTLNDALTNEAGATFDIQGDSQILATPLINNAKMVNLGTSKKTNGAANAQTTIAVPFSTAGYFWDFGGTIDVTGGLTQTGATSVTGLYANATLKAPTYALSGGKLYASGDFYGGFTNAAWVHPGMQPGVAGTFTIHGTYTRTGNGELYVEVAGVGAVGTLRVVQLNNAGGTASVGGIVTFHLNIAFTPGPMSVDFVFATAANFGQQDGQDRLVSLEVRRTPGGSALCR